MKTKIYRVVQVDVNFEIIASFNFYSSEKNAIEAINKMVSDLSDVEDWNRHPWVGCHTYDGCWPTVEMRKCIRTPYNFVAYGFITYELD